jgi:hypothetical protein
MVLDPHWQYLATEGMTRLTLAELSRLLDRLTAPLTREQINAEIQAIERDREAIEREQDGLHSL